MAQHCCAYPARSGLLSQAAVALNHTLLLDCVMNSIPLLKASPLCWAAALLAGCASPFFDVGRTETVLPVSRAWIDKSVVEYVTTDVSDLGMAQMTGANYVPRLRNAIAKPGNPSLLERVYKFPGAEQISIFQSAPWPAGAANADASYSPLWRVTLVHWAKKVKPVELKSEEELLAAQEKGLLVLVETDIVVNCPVTRAANGQYLLGVR
jgi:hypothetical protein